MTVIVPVGPGDAPWLALLHAAAFPDDPWPAAAIATLLGQPGVCGAAARSGDDPLGLILWRAVADEAEILTIGVVPRARGGGIGGRLVDHMLDALAPGTRAAFLEVAADNAAARALYARRGFAPAGRRAAYYRRAGGAVDALVLRRDIPTG